ncbi:MAG: ABC transporter substrate-binding protein [Treponema sp.]|jgi:raffinose/stachyose/melibiose transport system substrate-binding protein|nr:ABC transporter substrate-binding protein [Treponema sp.]
MKKILITAAVLLLGCGICFAKGSADSQKEKTVEISTNYSEEVQVEVCKKIFGDLVTEYNQKNGTDYQLQLLTGQGMDITNTRMSSGDKPDLFAIDSPADAQRYNKDGLLYDLSSYAKKYGWKNKMFPWAYDLALSGEKMMSVPFGYEGLLLWYNKSLMKKLGLDADSITDLASFENALQKAKDAGYIPVVLGTQDWPWAQEWYLSIMYSYTGRKLLKDTIEGKSKLGWKDPRFKKTVELYKSWNDKGYLADGKSYVLTSDDAINIFTTGKALFKLEGTWAPYWITPLDKEKQNNIGVMLHPAINDAEKPHLPIAIGQEWCVSSDTKNADICAFILDGLMRQNYQGTFLDAGMDVAPIKIDDNQYANLTPTVQGMWKIVNKALTDNKFGYATYAFYPPETRVYCYEGIVNVLTNKISIDDYLSKMQELNEKELNEGFIPVIPAVK